MIYTVTLNPSLDYIMRLSEYNDGRVNRSTNEKIYPGGKGINVSIVLKNLGFKNIALGFCAGDTGEILQKLLKEISVDTDFIALKEGRTRINVKIKAENETEINARGPEIKKEDMDKLYNKLKILNERDILVLSGSVGAFLHSGTYREILERIRSKGVKAVVDSSGDSLVESLYCRPFLIKPNIYELEEIFNKKLSGYDDIVSAGKELQHWGAKNVLISLGSEGAVLICENRKVIKKNAPKGEAINTTGAGDSMIAGFIAEYEKTGDYQKALSMGISAGSATAFSDNLATGEEIMKIYKSL